MERQLKVVSREIDGKLIGLDLRSSRYFTLNATGTLLWKMLDAGAQPSELAQALIDHYGIDIARARADVDSFLTSLVDVGLIER